MKSSRKWAIIGCGSQKLDLSGDKGPVTISRLYTSNYFELKREYAKTCCDEYLILSAKHGLVQPGFYVTDDYDLTVTDLNGTDLSQWVSDVSSELLRIADHHPEDTLVMLAGQDYLEPLEGALTHLPTEIEYPFEDTAGIGEQMNDLLDKVEAHGVNTGVVFADADFASGRLVNELKGRDVDFVIAYPTHFVSSYTDEWEEAEQTFGVEPYVINKTKTAPKRAEVTLFGEYQSKVGHAPDDAQQTLSKYFDPGAEYVTDRQNQKTLGAYVEREDAKDVFEADNRMRWFTFITNIDVGEAEARALREYYHYRWAIESAYADYKKNFLPSTRSTELGLRTYLYLFGMAAYNAWTAANVKARRQHLDDNARKRPPIRASRFMTLGQQRYRDEFHRDYINFRE